MADPDLDALVASVIRRAGERAARAGRCRIVAVDGPSGAGKTTLADAIGAALGAQVVHLDDLVPGWEGLAAGPAIVSRDVVAPLAAGRAGGYRRYDWTRAAYDGWVPVPLADHLVLDGCGAGAAVLAPVLSLLVWVEAPRAERYARAMARDGATYAAYWSVWERQEQQLYAVDDIRARADLEVHLPT